MVRKAKKLNMSRFLDPNQPAKKLWQNMNSIGRQVIMFTPDQLNNFFATASPRSTPSQTLSAT
jgi:hypothetical protein